MGGKKLRVVHFLNQFFGQIGSEEKATSGFVVKEGPVGPGLALQKELGDRGRSLPLSSVATTTSRAMWIRMQKKA